MMQGVAVIVVFPSYTGSWRSCESHRGRNGGRNSNALAAVNYPPLKEVPAMNKAKDDYINALEASADTLQRIVGDHILPEPLDSAGWKRVMSDPNFNAKWSLVFPVEALRGRAKSLRRNAVKKGDWR